MINLGPFSGKNCPNVRYQPSVVDRIFEGAALLALLGTLSSIYWFHVRSGEEISRELWIMGGISILTFVILAISAYVPVRLINFPVRVSERNIVVQYLLAVRFVRVINVILSIAFFFRVFVNYYEWASFLWGAFFLLLIPAFIVYYILAYRYR